MAKSAIVEWDDAYSIGIELIDEQHIKLIELTNKLYTSCALDQEKTKSDTIFLDVIHEIIDYVTYHFTTEERAMRKNNYPGYKIHKQEHENFAKEVLAKVEEFNLRKINSSLSFVHYLKDWVLNHIAVNDKKMGAYLLEINR
ncbi:MAG: bacteriohemerythrin [Leptospirales bacterium]|nr:bacteriohemerythrin [Leptospirales bacterium]